jgi:hypothetical protein
LEVQPAILVKVKVTLPKPTPVTTPAFVTVAIPVLLLVHVPPVVGDNVVLAPTQIVLGPVIFTIGFGLTVITLLGNEIQPVVAFVNLNVTEPAATPVAIPELLMVAILVLLLDHVPPVAGLKEVVFPTHIVFDPVRLITGLSFMVMVYVDSFVHDPEL